MKESSREEAGFSMEEASFVEEAGYLDRNEIPLVNG